MPRNEIEPLLTVQDVANYLQVSPKTIRNRMSVDPTFPRMKVGGSVRFRLADIDRWIAGQNNQAA